MLRSRNPRAETHFLACPVMLLQTVKPLQFTQIGTQRAVRLTCQVAFQAADDLQLREALLRAALSMGARPRIVA